MHFSTLYMYCPVCGSSAFVKSSDKSMHCPHCNFEMYVNASAAVAVFILNEAGELLVCKRANEPEKGTCDLPGGFVDANETVEQALNRELLEELNVQVNDARYLFSLPNQYEYSGLTVPTVDLFFVATLHQNQHLMPSDDVESCSFIPLADVSPALFGLNSIRKGVELFLKIHMK